MTTTTPVQHNADNLVALLQSAIKNAPVDQVPAGSTLNTGFGWLNEFGDIEKTLNYSQLDQEARKIATILQQNGAAPGDRALLLYPAGIEFVSAFFGCLYAGVIGIPVCAAPFRKQYSRIDHIVKECEPKFVLTTEKFYKKLSVKLVNSQYHTTHFSLNQQTFIATDEASPKLIKEFSPIDHQPDDVAYIQYTSGSTSSSKAVWITHRNAVYQAQTISGRCCPGEYIEFHPGKSRPAIQRGICWLPLYHDMGLVGHVFAPIYGNLPVLFMSPFQFLRAPNKFLKIVTKQQITHIAMPNFGYELCINKTPKEDLAEIDLSNIQVALTAAEPVLESTLTKFVGKFGECGFKAEMFYPCYGLAEATLLVSAIKRGQAPKIRSVTKEIADRSKIHFEGKQTSQKSSIVSCGQALNELELIIVDPELKVLCERFTVGEIWVRGPNVAKGYHGLPEEVTNEIFNAKHGTSQHKSYLRTGDMGFLDENDELFIVGRLKDIINIHGRAAFPQDIEWTVDSLPIEARVGCSAAFAVDNKNAKLVQQSSKDNKVVVMVELKGSHSKETLQNIEQKIKDAVREEHGIDLDDVIIVGERTIPKTTSGKVMRFACRNSYLNSPNATATNGLIEEKTPEDDPTVIVGMSCRLPRADNLKEFWNNLITGVDGVTKVPEDRWNAEAFYDADTDKPGKMPTDQGGFINNVEQFDALFFSISGREAEVMDPQQRIMLEVTYEALEDAGISMDEIKGTHTGVFMGSCFSDYHKIQCSDVEKIRPYVQTGSAQSILANRISYVFDLKGPSFSVDTACSSSLVALHLADKSLRSGDCKTAIVGGCSINLLPEMFVAFAKLHMLSPDGRCKSFDADGNGYVRAEGVCALVLKSRSQAIKDNDTIYAVIKGSGINQDGHTPGLTFPGQPAQEELLASIYQKANLKPDDIHYIEAHGTGTRAGDPVEVNAIGNILGKARNTPLLIGSVKSNIGHTEGASGLVGIVKVLLSMQNETIPANLHFKTPNPDIDFEGMRISVVSQHTPWPKKSRRRAGVNSFGFGGTNAHVVLEDVPAKESAPAEEKYRPFVISAHSKKAVEELALKFKEYLEANPNTNLRDLSYTLAVRRTFHPNRISVVAKTAEELIKELESAKSSKIKREILPLRLGFIFTGQGAQWYAMGRQLMKEEPSFKATITKCSDIIQEHFGWSLLDELAKDEETSLVHQPDISQPACCAIQIGLVDLFRSWGISPVAVLGHSSGEHGAVYAAGALSLKDSLIASAYRGIVMKQGEETGRMAAVGMSEQEAIEFLADYKGRVSLAAINSPTSVTLSGDGDAIEEIEGKLKAKDIFCRVLQVKRAFHSHHMVPVAPKLVELMKNIVPSQSAIPMISSVTGEVCTGPEFTGEYWARNMTGTVRFLDAVKKTIETQDVHAFIEIGPHPALQGPARQCLAVLGVATEKPIFPSLARNADEHHRMLTTVCQLHNMGAEINWRVITNSSISTLVRGLPLFPWQRQKFWHESEISIRARFRESAHELLGHRLPHPHGAWENELSLSNVGYLKDHQVQGNVVFPAAGYCALGIAAAGQETPATLQEMTFKRPIMFDPPEAPVKTQVVLNKDPSLGNKIGFTIYVLDNKQFVEISTGFIATGSLTPSTVDVQQIQQRCTSTISKQEIYNLFAEAGLEYGPFFQGIQSLARGDKEAIGEVIPPTVALSTSYLLHPTLLDACFQCLLGAVSSLSGSYLPTSIKSLDVLAPCHEASGYWIHAIAKEVNDRVLAGDILIFSKSGELLAKVDTLQCNSIGKKAGAKEDSINWSEHAYETSWKADIALLTPSNVRRVITNTEAPLDRDADRIATMYLQKALKRIEEEKLTVDEKHKKLYDWSVEYLKTQQPLDGLTAAEDNIEAVIMERVGKNLVDILTGKTDALSIVFADSLLYAIYEKGETFVKANGVVKQIVSAIKHKNTGLKVLEIGAGTGGTTSHVLPILSNHFESYTYTDISPSFFETARNKFDKWANKLKFTVLNIEKDPAPQGLDLGSFDLIIATDVLHATKNIVETLKNVHKLLAPGGSLVLNELTNTPIWVQTVFGTLAGWWLFEDPDVRTLGPTISADGWEKILYSVGFDKVLAIPDRENEGIHTIFSASRNPIAKPTLNWDILSTGSELAKELSTKLANSRVVSASDELGPNVIYLIEYEQQNFYNGMTSETFETIKKVLRGSQNVAWVIKGGLMDFPNPEQAPLPGFVRTVLNEYPSLHSITIDVGVDAAKAAEAIITATEKEIIDEAEVVYRDGIFYVPRLTSKTIETTPATLGEKDLTSLPVQLEVGTPGLLSTLRWREVKYTTPLGPNELDVAVRATGLNFKDIMLSMGMLGEEAVVGGFCTSNLGIECAGIVESVGSNATGEFKVGDRVVVVAKNCFSSRVRTISNLAVKIPDHITFEQAASIPATFLTASYALNYLAHVSEGETVLIHAAAGGVGIAAIQLCQLAKAEVYATVGTEEKRKFLIEEMGVKPDHIMSSRNLDFVTQIMEKTNGRGVDIVLNSLAGEALKKSFTILAPFGRFLEIGKRDIYGNSKLDMLPFGQNVSFFAIDLDRLNGQRPQLGGKLFRELIDLFERRLLKPLPVTTYSYANVEPAFRYMQQGKHIGKIVLSLTEGVKAEVLPSQSLFRSDRSYIMVGGLGGFGRAVAKWMSTKGAGHLAFISRSGASSTEAKELVQQLQQAGTKVSLLVGDVSDEAFVNKAVAETKAVYPIGGVLQAAMVLEDCFIEAMSLEVLNKVLAPKVKGTYNLHKATINEPTLEFFIPFSSISSIVGNLTQSNYAAANAYLDALAHWRQAHGLCATSINWGAIGDVGYVAAHKELQQNMAKRGISTLPIEEAFKALEYAIRNSKYVPQFAAAPMSWNIASKTLPALNISKFGIVKREDEVPSQQAQKASSSGSQIAQKLAAATTQEATAAVVLEAIREKLASMLNVGLDQVEGDNRMSDLGVDSLMAVEMKNWIASELKASNISVLDLTGGKNIADISDKIAKEIFAGSGSTSASQETESRGQFRKIHSPAQPRLRLLCFPHLGGNASSFNQLADVLPDVEIFAYEPTATFKTWEALLQALVNEEIIKESAKIPTVVYGHSLGGLIAYEVIRELQKNQKDAVTIKKLIVGATGSPNFPNDLVKFGAEWSDTVVENAPIEQLISVLLSGGLIDNTNDPEVIRASILLGRRFLAFHKTSDDIKLNIPINVIAAKTDNVIGDISRVNDWQSFTNSFNIQVLDNAQHLFHIQDQSIFGPTLKSFVSI